MTFKDVLTETRTELCERYLRQSDLSLTEIAFLVGFRDPNVVLPRVPGLDGQDAGAGAARIRFVSSKA